MRDLQAVFDPDRIAAEKARIAARKRQKWAFIQAEMPEFASLIVGLREAGMNPLEPTIVRYCRDETLTE